MEFKLKNFKEFLNEKKNDIEELKKTKKELDIFLDDKNFQNKKSKIFLFHGTPKHPKDFKLSDDYDGEDSGFWFDDLPLGYLFLTTDVNEALAYGDYIIPCELKKYDNLFFKVNSNNPSQVFDDDYGISYNNKTNFNFWEKFKEGGKSVLMIKGKGKSTIITDIDNVIPRVDLAKEFYKNKNK